MKRNETKHVHDASSGRRRGGGQANLGDVIGREGVVQVAAPQETVSEHARAQILFLLHLCRVRARQQPLDRLHSDREGDEHALGRVGQHRHERVRSVPVGDSHAAPRAR
eukprot:2145331-Rhodomonas_salina.1